MSEFKLTTVEEFEAATARLLETGAKVGADAWQIRAKNQTPHCKFGEQGICCRICAMGPCRITPKAPRGICGCDAHGIVGRNFLKFTAGGAATHSDHGREICHTLYCAKEGGNYQVKDPEKLLRIAKEWGVETEGKDIYDLAHEMAEIGLMEYGKPFGYQRFLDRMPAGQKEKLIENEIAPRAIDREVSTSLHMAHMGCSSLPEALVKQSIRCGLADGWGGSMMGTEFSDVLFGTPKPIDTEANLGVMVEENVNIVVHGHDPSLSEMICEYADSKEMIDYAKSVGAKGITVSGVCCTSNEVAMRRGVPMAGNFLQQENVVLTGACEAIVVDVQCIFPALGPLSKCFHTKFVTTSPIAQMPDAEFIRFNAETAGENAKAIVKMAIENFKNRKPELVHIPDMKAKATVGYSVEAIVKTLDGVTNSQVDETGTTKPLLECITSGKPLPFELEGQTIYYVGPTPNKPGCAIGSAGPTTSSRIDAYTPSLLERGLKGMLGKGKRSPEVKQAIVQHHAIYFIACGGAGALLSHCVKKREMVAYEDLLSEAITRLTMEDLPCFVGVDCTGKDVYDCD
mgnify:CR=1 FL=1